MTARETLGKVIWEASRADEGTISVTGANIVADAILAAHPGIRGVLDEPSASAEWSCDRGCSAPSAVCIVDHKPIEPPTDGDREALNAGPLSVEPLPHWWHQCRKESFADHVAGCRTPANWGDAGSTDPCDVCGRRHPGPGTPGVCDR